MSAPVIAYCGPAAVPADFWLRWNLDPVLLAALGIIAITLARGRTADNRSGWGALALMVVVFVSPLCALSSALFSARVLHHVLLIAAIAPLLARAFPAPRLPYPSLATLVGVHAVVLWLWHAPGVYTWGLASVPTYWLMQLTLLGTAWALWRGILAPAAETGPALLALVSTVAQMGLLGALIVFAPQPLYLVHLTGAAAWGITPLADQQLAGLLMWVPAILPYLGVGLWLAWSGLRSDAADPGRQEL